MLINKYRATCWAGDVRSSEAPNVTWHPLLQLGSCSLFSSLALEFCHCDISFGRFHTRQRPFQSKQTQMFFSIYRHYMCLGWSRCFRGSAGTRFRDFCNSPHQWQLIRRSILQREHANSFKAWIPMFTWQHTTPTQCQNAQSKTRLLFLLEEPTPYATLFYTQRFRHNSL